MGEESHLGLSHFKICKKSLAKYTFQFHPLAQLLYIIPKHVILSFQVSSSLWDNIKLINLNTVGVGVLSPLSLFGKLNE